MRNPPPGCIFNNRCPFAMDKCRKEEPPSYKVSEDHYVACFLQGGK
jgi:peptide/nickel transport system ATP-binding protein